MASIKRKHMARGSVAPPRPYSGTWVREQVRASGLTGKEFCLRLGTSPNWLTDKYQNGCSTLHAFAIHAATSTDKPPQT